MWFVLMLSLYLGKYSFTCFFFCVGVWNLVSHREVGTQIKRASERHNNHFRSSCWTNWKADNTFEDPDLGQRMMTFFFSHHMPFADFVVLPPGHGRSVTDFWGWDGHEAQLRCPDGVWVVIEEDVVPGGVLNLNSTNLPRPWSPRESSLSRKIPTVEPGIEPGTSWLVVRDSGH